MAGVRGHRNAVSPRTPGRDYTGTAAGGPVELVGKEVWGCGGEPGIRRGGTHAEWPVGAPSTSPRSWRGRPGRD